MKNYLGVSEFYRNVDDLDYKLSIPSLPYEPVTLTTTQLTTVKMLISAYNETSLEVEYLKSKIHRLENKLKQREEWHKWVNQYFHGMKLKS